MLVGINHPIFRTGSFIIISTTPLIRVKSLTGFTDILEQSADTVIRKDVSYSYDRVNWSEFAKPDATLWKSIDISNDEINIKIRYTIVSNPYEAYFTVRDVTINAEYGKAPEKCTVSVPGMNGLISLAMNPDDDTNEEDQLEDTLAGMEIALNYFINTSPAAYKTTYYRTMPDKDTVDVFLNEYSIRGVVEKKDIKVVAEGGELPDNKIEYSEWGLGLTQFEVFMSKLYWETIFGVGTTPRNDDFLHIHRGKDMWRVKTWYVDNGIAQADMFYCLQLVKYDEDTATLKPECISDEIEKMSLTTEKLFGDQMRQEIQDVQGGTQNLLNRLEDDKYREYMHRSIVISDKPLAFAGQMVFRNRYDFSSIPAGDRAITYKSPIALDKSISISAWMNLPESGSYQLYSSAGLVVGMEDGKMVISVGQSTHKFAVPAGAWYGYCLNVSREHGTVSAYTYDPSTSLGTGKFDRAIPQSFKDVRKDTKLKAFPGATLDVVAGPWGMANLRVWRQAVPEEFMQIALLSPTVTKASSAYVIDNVDEIFNLGKMGPGKLL